MKWLTLVFLSTFAVVVALADRGELPPLLMAVYALPLGDKFVHLGLAAGAVFLLDSSLAGRRVRLGSASVSLACLVVVVGLTCEESSQTLVPQRVFDPLDLVASYLGIVLGAGLARRVRARVLRARSSDRPVGSDARPG